MGGALFRGIGCNLCASKSPSCSLRWPGTVVSYCIIKVIYEDLLSWSFLFSILGRVCPRRLSFDRASHGSAPQRMLRISGDGGLSWPFEHPGGTLDSSHNARWVHVDSPNDPSSATRRTGGNACNREAPAGFTAAQAIIFMSQFNPTR